jgi:hypothetical protein
MGVAVAGARVGVAVAGGALSISGRKTGGSCAWTEGVRFRSAISPSAVTIAAASSHDASLRRLEFVCIGEFQFCKRRHALGATYRICSGDVT